MPHLEVQTFAAQVFWLAICFVMLYVVLWSFVIPRISGVIETRGATIAENLSEAEKAKNEAEKLAAQQEKLALESAEKARKMIDESMQKAKVAVDKKRAILTEKLDEKLAKAEKEIAKVEKESIVAVDKVSAELTDMIISKFKAA